MNGEQENEDSSSTQEAVIDENESGDDDENESPDDDENKSGDDDENKSGDDDENKSGDDACQRMYLNKMNHQTHH